MGRGNIRTITALQMQFSKGPTRKNINVRWYSPGVNRNRASTSMENFKVRDARLKHERQSRNDSRRPRQESDSVHRAPYC
jgi:hypothetical protein